MHIVIVGSQGSIHTIRWANALVERGFRVDVFSMHQRIDEFNPKVTVTELPFKNPFGYLLNIPVLKRKLKKISPDIIHSFYALGHGFLARNSGFRPHIISVLGSDIYDDIDNPIFKGIIRRNLSGADAVCSTSLAMEKKINDYYKRKVEITPFGIDTKLFNPRRFQLNNKDTFVVGTVKWLESKYGIDTLIRSFAKFHELNPKIKKKLVIVGNGTKEEEYFALASTLGVSDLCDFKGKVAHGNIPKELSNFDIYVALSRLNSESFGVAILEASSMELPVLVSNVGGLPEVVKNLETGIVVEKEDYISAASAMEKLCMDASLRERMGKSGRKRVLDHYDWDQSVNRMIRLYKEILLEH